MRAMKIFGWSIFLFVVLGAQINTLTYAQNAAAAVAIDSEAALRQNLNGIVINFRQMILVGSESAPDNDHLRFKVGQWIMQDSQQRLDTLALQLTQKGSARQQAIVLDFIETETGLWDADKLAFGELLNEIARQKGLSPAFRARVVKDQKVLGQIARFYEKELGDVVNRLTTRGMDMRRQNWEKYLEAIRAKWSVGEIVALHKDNFSDDEEIRLRGNSSVELNGSSGQVPRGYVLLTFDDGPHLEYTPKIQQTLEKNGVHAVFFQLGNRLQTGNRSVDARARQISQSLWNGGHTLGNHSFSHPVLAKLDTAVIEQEVGRTQEALGATLFIPPEVFRAPYGSRNSKVMSVLANNRLKSIMWNIDSLDWSDKIPASIADRVIQQAREQGGGIILMHDIHKTTLEALPLILEGLKRNGFRFARWTNGAITE